MPAERVERPPQRRHPLVHQRPDEWPHEQSVGPLGQRRDLGHHVEGLLVVALEPVELAEVFVSINLLTEILVMWHLKTINDDVQCMIIV